MPTDIDISGIEYFKRDIRPNYRWALRTNSSNNLSNQNGIFGGLITRYDGSEHYTNHSRKFRDGSFAKKNQITSSNDVTQVMNAIVSYDDGRNTEPSDTYDCASAAVAYALTGHDVKAEHVLNTVAYMMQVGLSDSQLELAYVAKTSAKVVSEAFQIGGAGSAFATKDDIFYQDAPTDIKAGRTAWVGYAMALNQLMHEHAEFDTYMKGIATYLYNQRMEDVVDGLTFIATNPDSNTRGVSTEHMVDAYFFFEILGRLFPEGEVAEGVTYAAFSESLKNSLLQGLLVSPTSDAAPYHFAAGYAKSGSSYQRNDEKALDANSWGSIFLTAIGELTKSADVLGYVESTFASTVSGASGYQPYRNNVVTITGYTTNWTANKTVWSEGSFGVAVAYQKLYAASGIESYSDKAQAIVNGLSPLKSSGQNIYKYAYPKVTESGDVTFPDTYSAAGTNWAVILKASQRPELWQFWSTYPMAPVYVGPSGGDTASYVTMFAPLNKRSKLTEIKVKYVDADSVDSFSYLTQLSFNYVDFEGQVTTLSLGNGYSSNEWVESTVPFNDRILSVVYGSLCRNNTSAPYEVGSIGFRFTNYSNQYYPEVKNNGVDDFYYPIPASYEIGGIIGRVEENNSSVRAFGLILRRNGAKNLPNNFTNLIGPAGSQPISQTSAYHVTRPYLSYPGYTVNDFKFSHITVYAGDQSDKPYPVGKLTFTYQISGEINEHEFSFGTTDQSILDAMTLSEIDLSNPEQEIVSIEGTYGTGSHIPNDDNSEVQAIRSVTFHTNTTSYGPYGHYVDGSAPFQLNLPVGYQLRLWGAVDPSGKFLSNLGIAAVDNDKLSAIPRVSNHRMSVTNNHYLKNRFATTKSVHDQTLSRDVVSTSSSLATTNDSVGMAMGL